MVKKSRPDLSAKFPGAAKGVPGLMPQFTGKSLAELSRQIEAEKEDSATTAVGVPGADVDSPKGVEGTKR